MRSIAPLTALLLVTLFAPAQAQTRIGDTVIFDRAPTKAEIEAILGAQEPGRLTRSLRRGIRFHDGAAPRRHPPRADRHPLRLGSARSASRTPQPDPRLPPLEGRALNIAIQFAFDSDGLLLSEGNKLTGLIEYLRENDVTLLIAGHADASGARGYNFGLSARRAASVRAYLVRTAGFAPARFVTAGYGETRLLEGRAPNDPLNRRVEFRLIEGAVEVGPGG